MALNFNSEPYYDDFDDTKGFHRILFKPSYAVQARELTQLQTQLQDQIKKFGNNIFREGTVVVGGQTFYQNDLVTIEIGANLFGNNTDVTIFEGQTIVGQSSNTEAIVGKISFIEALGGYILVSKITSGNAFTPGETINMSIGNLTYTATIQLNASFDDASMFSVSSGVYYIAGKFVYTPNQSVIVDATTNNPTKNIGFTVLEEFISSENDESLLDNSQGSLNYAAPGADRYAVNLTLTSKDLATNIDDFVEIARIVNGELVVNSVKTIYSEIGNELARRTFDESGDYTIKPWPIQILNNANPDKFTVGLNPGKGYVKGFEFETIGQTFLEVDRSRNFAQADEINVAVTYGNYVNVDTVSGVFNTGTLQSVNLVDGTSATIGVAKVRYLKYVSGTIGTTGAVYRMYLFDIQMNSGKVFSDVATISSATGSATIDSTSQFDGAGTTFLSGSDSPGLVFPFNNTFIKTVKDSLGDSQSNYQYQRTYTSVTFSAGVAAINTPNGLQRFVGSGTLSDILKDEWYHVVVTDVGTSGFSVGDVIRFNTGAGRSIALSTPSEGSTQSATFNVGASVSLTATIIATIDANAQPEKTKAISNYQYKIISTPNTVIGARDSLEKSDIYNVLAIYNTSTTNPTTQLGTAGKFNTTTGAITWDAVPNTEVTTNYSVDDGQRAEFYDHGSIILDGTAPGASDYIVVVYRNFSHTGSGFFSVDSYSIPYEDIPSFVDPASGIEYQLRDSIDFRPRRSDGATGLVGNQIPNPLGTFDTDYQYYLSRMDRIIAMPDNTFQVKQGNPSILPSLPINDTNGMVIYDLVIPAYTAKLDDVAIRYANNKRYTMKDIGKLEKRISNIEYYTQLSALEKQARDTNITDSSNIEKFKNGIATDPFVSQDIFTGAGSKWSSRRWGWWTSWFNGSNTWNTFSAQSYEENSIADPSNIDFNAAIDPVNQELRAPFDVDYYEFNPSTMVNMSNNGDLATLNFTEVVVVDQPLATGTINVNPFDVIKFLGSINLEPSFDNWIDTVSLPAVNRLVDVRVPDAEDRIVNTGATRGPLRVISTSTQTVTNVLSTATSSLGVNVVDIQFVPFIRQSSVAALCKLFKPNARLYPFLDGENISSYCRPLTLVTVQNHTGALFNDAQGVYEDLTFTGGAGATAKTGLYSQPTTIDNTKRLLTVFDESGTITVGDTVTGSNGGSATVTAVTTYSLGDFIIPDEFGNIGVNFEIPDGVFKTGERTIRFIDNLANNSVIQESVGEAIYTATGLLKSTQETLLTTRSLQNQRVVTRTLQRYDPVAQTFDVDFLTYPDGFHLSSVDIYFNTKSNTVPVTVEIRRTVNGYPESTRTIPFSESVLQAESVSVSEDGSVATNFAFASPIHLAPGEYSIVVLSNTSEYNIFIAEMNETVIGGSNRVDKQPYIGSLFVSQNAGTWTADQNKDMKFRINAASFATSGSMEFAVRDPGDVKDYQTLFANVSTVSPSNTNIIWEAKAYTAGGVFESSFTRINVNQDVDYTSVRRLANASGIGGTSLILKATLSTSNTFVSPVIDTKSLAVAASLNTINNDTTNEDSNSGGNALAKYITKAITLVDGFDASNLVVTMDINKPPSTNVKVYFKYLPVGQATPLTDEDWQEMVLENSVQNSSFALDYKEHKFYPSGAFVSGVPVDSPIPNRFNVFRVKIVMTSTNEALTPKIRDLRIIALDS
jgi:hypothetical protein